MISCTLILIHLQDIYRDYVDNIFFLTAHLQKLLLLKKTCEVITLTIHTKVEK